MTWISLVCLLALSSAVFGQSNYGVFSGSSLFKPKSVVPVPDVPSNYGSYDKFESRRLSFDLPKPATLPLSEADILCKGKPEGFIIVLLAGEKFVICTTDSKGDEFFCPDGLLYNDATKRCERKYNPNKDPCGSQPCLFGGRCIPTQYTYECECTPGYSGRTCELDATVCQQEYPCGYSSNSICQSFRVGSALKHVCILQEGEAYCSDHRNAFKNPCMTSEGYHPLGFTDKGFIKCDGETMSVVSCPGGQTWDPATEVCVLDEKSKRDFSIASQRSSGSAIDSAAVRSDLSIPSAAPRFSPFAASLRSGGGGGGSSSVDRGTRSFQGREFISSSRGQETTRGERPAVFTGARLPGASSAGGFRDDPDRSTRGNLSDDDSNSISIPFRSRTSAPNPLSNRGGFDRRSFMPSLPGASSRSNMFADDSLRR